MSLADAFAGMKKPQSSTSSTSSDVEKSEGVRSNAEAAAIARHAAAQRAPLPVGTAKYNHPDYKAVKVYLRKETRKAAERKWEDANGGDLSELVEQLLQKYLRA